MKTTISLLSILLLTACGTVQTIKYPYQTVAEVLKERFVKQHDAFKTTKPRFDTYDDSMTISFDVEVDFYFAISPEISIRKEEKDESSITVKVVEYYKSWSYQARNKKMEAEFIDTLKKRLKTGKWDKLPWEKKENLNPSIFSAVFRGFGE